MSQFSLKRLFLAVALIGSGAGMISIWIKRFGQTDQLLAFVATPFLGAALLAASVAALIAHLVGGFRDIKDE